MSRGEFSTALTAAIDRADPELETALEELAAAHGHVQAENERLRREKRELLDELEETNRGTIQLTAELEERYQQLFENAVEGIYKTTPDAERYVVANPAMASILGYESVDDLYRAVDSVRDDVFVDDDRYAAYRETLRSTGQLDDFEYRVRRADGESRWLSDSTTALVDDDGNVEGYQGGVVDITERKKRERRLEDHRDKLGVLNQIIRHDIRNDMNVILGWGQMLETEVSGDDADALRRVLDTSQHVVELTSIVRDVVESLSEETSVHQTVVDLAQILEMELDAHRAAHPEATVRWDGVDEPIPVRANETLSSVFQNLLHNAVQHNDADGPEITVSVNEYDETVVVRIADNGPGIPESERETLFEKHQKGQESTGSGLGLYLVRVLVDQYHGDVWVEDGDADGAVFGVELQKATRAR